MSLLKSGLALPWPLIQAFNWTGIRGRFTLDGVVTLVDGPALSSGSVAHDPAALEVQRVVDDDWIMPVPSMSCSRTRSGPQT